MYSVLTEEQKRFYLAYLKTNASRCQSNGSGDLQEKNRMSILAELDPFTTNLLRSAFVY